MPENHRSGRRTDGIAVPGRSKRGPEKKTEQLADRILKLSLESLKYLVRQINECMKYEWTHVVELDTCIRKDFLAGFITKEAPVRLKSLGKIGYWFRGRT